MPVMNFFDAQLEKEDGKYTVELDADKQKRLKKLDIQSQPVTLGVRPEHTEVGSKGVEATVEVSEMMGSSIHLHANADGHDVSMIVPFNNDRNIYAMGDKIHFTFSKETGKNLEF